MKPQLDEFVDRLFGAQISLGEAIELLERKMIQRALESSGGKQTLASQRLGIHRNTLQRKMAQYQLENGRRKPASRAGRAHLRKTGAA